MSTSPIPYDNTAPQQLKPAQRFLTSVSNPGQFLAPPLAQYPKLVSPSYPKLIVPPELAAQLSGQQPQLQSPPAQQYPKLTMPQPPKLTMPAPPQYPKLVNPNSSQASTPDDGGPTIPMQSAPNPFTLSSRTPTQAEDDQGKLDYYKATGSGIDQIKNPYLRGLARTGDIIGNVASAVSPVARVLMQQLPGTSQHHNVLVSQQTGIVNQDQEQAEKQAQTDAIGANIAHTNAETAYLPQSEADKHALTQAQIGNFNSEASERGKPKDAWKELAGYSGPSGEPLEINEATGETRVANAPAGSKAINKKESSPAQETYDSLLAQGLSPMQAYEKIREKPGGTVINQGTWVLDEDPTTGKPVLFNSKTGETREAPAGVAKAGTFAKNEAKAAPEKAALDYANDYVPRSVHTGSGDEALMEKFFELAKPSTGFRMSQPQIDMLKNAQGWMGGLEAHLRHATTGTWFSDEQRKQIAGTMNDLARSKGIDTGTVATPGAASHPGSDMITVQIPGFPPSQIHVSQKAAFLARYPNAKVQ